MAEELKRKITTITNPEEKPEEWRLRVAVPTRPYVVKEFERVRSITYDPLKRKAVLRDIRFKAIASLPDIHRISLRRAEVGTMIPKRKAPPQTVYVLPKEEVCGQIYDPVKKENLLVCGETYYEALRKIEEAAALTLPP